MTAQEALDYFIRRKAQLGICPDCGQDLDWSDFKRCLSIT